MRRVGTASALSMLIIVILGSHALNAFRLFDRRWTSTKILLDVNLGDTRLTSDEPSDWNRCAAGSLTEWNTQLPERGFQFVQRPGKSVPAVAGDALNSVRFADDVFGLSFGSGVVGATHVISRVTEGIDETLEADILLNSTVAFNCYRGPQQVSHSGQRVHDLRRTVTHALGHVIGLGHPDGVRYSGAALMDAMAGGSDTLQPNDIQGARTLFGAVATMIPFPPRDQVRDFFQELETEYQTTLGRSDTNAGYVDAEGTAVWFPEWLRYVLNECSPEDATTRVFMQIRGQGIQPVCGQIQPGIIAFPARDLSLAFLEELNSLYREELNRTAILGPVDLEGKAVWLQEYLRYRVNGHGEDNALALVREQIRLAATDNGGSGEDDTQGGSKFFQTGQAADLLLGAVDFNRSGGPSLFNHPKGIATDGTALMLADGNNNRVLVWTTLPGNNAPPDLVLGQPSFLTNDSGEGNAGMKWPVDVAAGGGKYLVADTYNHRILVWDGLPDGHGAAPDLILSGVQSGDEFPLSPRTDRFVWPWGVWTDGEKLIVAGTAAGSSTGGVGFGGWILIWNTFPTSSDQAADIVLSGEEIGTPRSITTDGHSFLIVGDHNASGQNSKMGSWFWSTFPTQSDTTPTGFITEESPSIWLAGDVSAAGQLLMIGSAINIWNSVPASSNVEPDLRLDGRAWGLRGGDGSTIAVADDRVYVSDYNSNRILGFSEVPTSETATPDIVLGAPDISTDTFAEHDFITNGVPRSDGQHLLIGDGYDKRLHCWTTIPTTSASTPTAVVDFADGVHALALHDNTVVAAGPMNGLRAWVSGVPCDGRAPDVVYGSQIGSITVESVQSLALDGQYLYVLDSDGGLYIWDGLPESNEAPLFSLEPDIAGADIYSDGEHLSISGRAFFGVMSISDLGSDSQFTEIPDPGWSSAPGQGIVSGGHVFRADLGYNRVTAWERLDDALAGVQPDVLLGATGTADTDPDTTQEGLFWPSQLGFDGQRLWVAEYKFSGRVVSFKLPE